MNKKQTLIILGALILLLSVVTVTYGYITATMQSKNQEVSLTTGTISLAFSDNDNGISGQIGIGQSITKKFVIENTGTLDATANIYWNNLVNTYLTESLTYKLEYSETVDGTYEVLEIDSNIPQSLTASKQLLTDAIYVPVNKKYYYNLTITFENLPDIDQTGDLDASLITAFDIEGTHYNALMAVNGATDLSTPFLGGTIARDQYEAIYTVDNINIPSSATHRWDVSYLQNGSVMAWNTDVDSDGMYELYLGQKGGVVANVISKDLFRNCVNAITIDLSNLDTSKVRSMHRFFAAGNPTTPMNVTDLNISSLNTSKVTDMSGMFQLCLNIIELDLSHFDTKKVTNMKQMFSSYNNSMNLTKLNITGFNTHNVTDMSGMFQLCSNITELNLSHFDTTNVTDMSYMFSTMTSLKNLNISNFNTVSVQNTQRMFAATTLLETINMKQMIFPLVSIYTNMFTDSGVDTIILENQNAQTFIQARLADAGISATILSA